jgi:hypothetical protein
VSAYAPNAQTMITDLQIVKIFWAFATYSHNWLKDAEISIKVRKEAELFKKIFTCPPLAGSQNYSIPKK